MNHASKYHRQYFMPPVPCYDWVQNEYIKKPPIWCSVDLRDGNQALIVPMSLEEKLTFFQHLVKIGFHEIEVGFPAASQTEFAFCRRLIEENLIPDDVTIQVLTQSREHIIKRTFEALKGCKRATIHLYNSTSVAQREQVFRKSKPEIVRIAKEGARLLLSYAQGQEGTCLFEYYPESVKGTEMEFASEICNEVLEVWKPTPQAPVIINLPVTVQHSMPHVYACQVEYMGKQLQHRESVLLSLHPHNDRGCAVADSELGLLAGADRIEGTLFGNGERTGNVDIITLALNLYSHGVDPKLEFSHLPEVMSAYENLTHMHVYERQPYSGKLVFAAFSGSHQDAIAKGMDWRQQHEDDCWSVPYLPIDPKDIGREYEGDVIRINSQSGKGGIGYLLERRYGYQLPKSMREDLGYAVKDVSDRGHRELMPEEVLQIFKDRYLNLQSPYEVKEAHYQQNAQVEATVTVRTQDGDTVCVGAGNGRLDAVSNALSSAFGMTFEIMDYTEHAASSGSGAQACCYVQIKSGERTFWGAGTHTDIISASVSALVSAINRMARENAA